LGSISSLGIGKKNLICREAWELGNLFPPGYAVSGNDSHASPRFGSKRQVNNHIPGKERNNIYTYFPELLSALSKAPPDTGRKPSKTQKKKNQILPGCQV